MQGEQRGHLRNAGRAPGGPEVQYHYLSTVTGEVNRGGAVGNREVGSNLARLSRVRAAVAAGRKRDGQKQKEREKTREPHVSIIRSERASLEG
jgi:hypothetical protein